MKSDALQDALMKSTGRAAVTASSVVHSAEVAHKASGRAGLVNVSAWLPPQFKQNLLMLKALGKGDVQDLVAEALNDLFAKHNQPVVRIERE